MEKDITKLNLVKYDLAFEVDALFKNMTARFNESGARGLLLKSLPFNNNLEIMLESSSSSHIYTNTFDKKKVNIDKELALMIESIIYI